ncbi:penicillin-binding protein 1C [bacterium]
MKFRFLIKKRFFTFIFLIVCIFLFLYLSHLRPNNFSSKRIYDRNGILLREINSSEYGTAYPIKLDSLPKYFKNILIKTEDRRFYFHLGVDPIAISRALFQNIKNKRIVSGGSTITQQLVRNIYHYPRILPYKIIEAMRAICIEIRYSKKRILEEYVNRIPFGNGAYGIEAASRLYFAKPAKDLSLAESVFLCGIPSSNKLFNPYRRFNSALNRQKRILDLLYSKGEINKFDYKNAVNESLVLYPKRRRFLAPHFCDWILRKYKNKLSNKTITTLDYNAQRKVEYIVTNHIKKLEKANVTNASVIVVDNFTNEILAFVGSNDFFDEEHSGQVNGALALRQPGSTVKPFLYGLAFEFGFTAASILADIETSIKISNVEVFTPRNYDKKFHGMVRARMALACSYNVATVNLCDKVGYDNLFYKLKEAGFSNLDKEPKFYGPGLSLGTGEVTLFELVRAYSGLANEGELKDLKVFLNDKQKNLGRFFNPKVAYLLTDILADNNAREPAFGAFSPLNLPFKCAAKTGTSKDFRDNWTIGYTPRYTVGVWVGNFDGKPMYSVSGITGAGPIFRDIMITLEVKNENLDFKIPHGLKKQKICSKSGKLPKDYCPEIIEEIFIKDAEPDQYCETHQLFRIDKKSGAFVDEDWPEDLSREKVIEVYPIEYHDWAKNSGITMTGFFNKKMNYLENKVYVDSPQDGDRFKIDPILRKEYQRITLKPNVTGDVVSVKWFVDEKAFFTRDYPFTISWQLEQGSHEIYFVACTRNKGDFKSSSVNIKVLN